MHSKSPLVFSFDAERGAAGRLAAELGFDATVIGRHAFPDGESLITVRRSASTAVFYCRLDRPNDKLFDLFLAASAMRDMGSEQIILVAPYLPYMRQDVAFHPGESVSQRVLGNLIGEYVDAVVAVDPHLHRTKELGAVFPNTDAVALSAAPELGRALKTTQGQAASECVLIGPDEESAPLIELAADAAGCSWMVGCKVRHGDRDVVLNLPDDVSLEGRKAVILDDVISSGTTIKACTAAALERGATSVDVYVTHALFGEDDEIGMRQAGVTNLISCDGVPHITNGIQLAPLLAQGVRLCLSH